MELKNNTDKKTPCIAVFGTGSEVGKSVVAAALCRCFANNGIRVAPFKAQNMSNNSGVTPEGLEMGRAQIVQAEAAKIPPNVDMNPVLLKPTSEVGAQVVFRGKVLETSTARDYHENKERLFAGACAALDRLKTAYELIVIEGAGSCAEVNLMPNDIVNFRMAEYADAPVILVADIHGGGVFGQIVGTLECLPEHYRKKIAGFIINRFRGDIGLFKEGVEWIERKTGKKVLGVLPWFSHLKIEAEDSVSIENPVTVPLIKDDTPAIAVIRIPHISNFTDFDPLSRTGGIELHFIEKILDLSQFAAVILPGSKNTRFDLAWLAKTGWAKELVRYADSGGSILGTCGGYQMMGSRVHDLDGLEGPPGATPGLSLLPVETFMKAPKTTTLSRFCRGTSQGTGYEIHMGETKRYSGEPLFTVTERNGVRCEIEDGCVADGAKIMGTYMHGMFDSPDITKFWLDSAGLSNARISEKGGPVARDGEYDLLAGHFKKHVDFDAIAGLVELKGQLK